jgi:hypothetical protein
LRGAIHISPFSPRVGRVFPTLWLAEGVAASCPERYNHLRTLNAIAELSWTPDASQRPLTPSRGQTGIGERKGTRKLCLWYSSCCGVFPCPRAPDGGWAGRVTPVAAVAAHRRCGMHALRVLRVSRPCKGPHHVIIIFCGGSAKCAKRVFFFCVLCYESLKTTVSIGSNRPVKTGNKARITAAARTYVY